MNLRDGMGGDRMGGGIIENSWVVLQTEKLPNMSVCRHILRCPLYITDSSANSNISWWSICQHFVQIIRCILKIIIMIFLSTYESHYDLYACTDIKPIEYMMWYKPILWILFENRRIIMMHLQSETTNILAPAYICYGILLQTERSLWFICKCFGIKMQRKSFENRRIIFLHIPPRAYFLYGNMEIKK